MILPLLHILTEPALENIKPLTFNLFASLKFTEACQDPNLVPFIEFRNSLLSYAPAPSAKEQQSPNSKEATGEEAGMEWELRRGNVGRGQERNPHLHN